MTKYKYRIVTDDVLGFEAQYKPKWSFHWKTCFDSNTHFTKEEALECIDEHKRDSMPKPPFVSSVVHEE